jgi:hypothetical protein
VTAGAAAQVNVLLPTRNISRCARDIPQDQFSPRSIRERSVRVGATNPRHCVQQLEACGIAALAFLVAAPLLAQSQGRGDSSPRYDAATEATVTGTVESVEQITGSEGGRGRRGLGGTHITLKTSAETLEVHLGPTAFLNEKRSSLPRVTRWRSSALAFLLMATACSSPRK